MANTTAKDVIESFESSFADKQVIPESLENMWLLKAIGRFSVEIEPLNYDEDLGEFDTRLGRYVIDSLAAMMKVLYMERQYSLVNKRVSISGKDLSIDGAGSTKNHTKSEFEFAAGIARDMIENQKPSAYL